LEVTALPWPPASRVEPLAKQGGKVVVRVHHNCASDDHGARQLVEIFVHTFEAHEFERRLVALGEPMSAEEK
jgi:hypothetical protein